MDLFARNEGERYLCGLIDWPCQTTSLDELVLYPANGAIAQFFGVVRNHNEGLSAAAVDYDVHPELALKALSELCQDVCADYPVKLVMIHSRGLVRVGEASVVIAASSAHRKDALGAVTDAIDQLKIRVPIWKKEIGLDDEQRWLDGHSLRKD
ncbi:MAG: molybdenum cofactor biosynthesis protein MoaE [Gammaproteobacteria bacterium]